jgi:hypothetical protein
MHNHNFTGREFLGVALLATTLMAGCAHHRPPPPQFASDAPYSRTFSGSGDSVCWSVKRALLSQGYMLDRPNDAGVLTGSRDAQPQPKLNVTTRLQTSCADNRNGTSIVFVTATREDSQLQKMKQTTSVGVGPATLTMPAGSAQVLGTVRRATVTDPDFYNQFFALVQTFVDQEQRTAQSRPQDGMSGAPQAATVAPPSAGGERLAQGAAVPPANPPSPSPPLPAQSGPNPGTSNQ